MSFTVDIKFDESLVLSEPCLQNMKVRNLMLILNVIQQSIECEILFAKCVFAIRSSRTELGSFLTGVLSGILRRLKDHQKRPLGDTAMSKKIRPRAKSSRRGVTDNLAIWM